MERVILALLLLVTVIAIGVAGFVFIEGLPFIDALYMTMATISTLGMKGAGNYEVSKSGQLWIIFLITVGIVSAMIALTTIVGMVVEGHMRNILGRRKVNVRIASLSNHIIVCGFGRMGQQVCNYLKRRGTSVVVIDNDDHRTVTADQEGFLYVLGDATDETILRDAGIERARGLIGALPTDASNVFVTLTARGLNEKLFIAARAERVESETQLLRAGANKAICPQVIGAQRLANILTRPGVVDFIDFASEGLELEAEQFRISPGNKLVGKSLREANLPREAGILIIAIKRSSGETIFNPGPDTIIEIDDVMIVTGQIGSMAKLGKLYS
jgi:voltage-gated potassium channel